MKYERDAVKKSFNFFERNRRLITGGFILAGLPLILFTRHAWPRAGRLTGHSIIAG